jgi:hypothetical protein
MIDLIIKIILISIYLSLLIYYFNGIQNKSLLEMILYIVSIITMLLGFIYVLVKL